MFINKGFTVYWYSSIAQSSQISSERCELYNIEDTTAHHNRRGDTGTGDVSTSRHHNEWWEKHRSLSLQAHYCTAALFLATTPVLSTIPILCFLYKNVLTDPTVTCEVPCHWPGSIDRAKHFAVTLFIFSILRFFYHIFT